MRKASVDFSKKIRDWDGFGVNYVEVAQTEKYLKDPQEYGGFSILSEDDRIKILDMIFGEDGLKPGLVKMFFDPFQQKEENLNPPGPDNIDLDNYDHQTTTKLMRLFVREGLKRTRERGEELSIITTLYSPPAWMTEQKLLRGRDLDPEYEEECAKYLVAWAKFLKEIEGFPVKYICLHNEGESWERWPLDGSDGNIGTGHDYNMYWPPEQVAKFIKVVGEILEAQGLGNIGVAPGETTNWYRFAERGYAYAIADDPEAMANLDLITSHGFYVGRYGRWFGPHTSLGADILREKKPELHSWVTSTSWSKMDPDFVFEIMSNIYYSKVNGIIPWSCIQRPEQWVGGDPNPGTAFRVHEDGTYEVMPGYYYYKQASRAGQSGMAVTRVTSNDSEVGIIAFADNGTGYGNNIVLINIGEEDKDIDINIAGTDDKVFEVYRTSDRENYVQKDDLTVVNGKLNYTMPARSVATLYSK